MRAVLLVSHGSRLSETKKEVSGLVNKLRAKDQTIIFEYAFLEIEKPDIEEGLDTCVRKGADEIIVLLNFLNSGQHVNCDIPEIVKKAQTRHPQTTIRITGPIGRHPKIADLFWDMISS